MKTKVNVLLLAVCLLLSVQGCSNDASAEAPPSPVSEGYTSSGSGTEHESKGITEATQGEPDEYAPSDQESSAPEVVQSVTQKNLTAPDAEIDALALGESFNNTVELAQGTLLYTVNSYQISDNVKELNIEPSELDENELVLYLVGDSGEDMVAFESREDYVDMQTGQLADHLRVVLADITVENVDAKAHTAANDPNNDVYNYIFNVASLQLCDTSQIEDNGAGYLSCISIYPTWYANTGEYDASLSYNGAENHFILRPGETLTYQAAFIVGNEKDDFTHLYLSNSYGNFEADNAEYVWLDPAKAS